jgi:hypothetical protein
LCRLVILLLVFWRRICGCTRSWLAERVCWALSDAYHANEGGHIRIYRADVLRTRLAASGLEPAEQHHAHALHAPFWWLKCAVGTDNDDHPLVDAYHRMLVWDLMSAPRLTRYTERVLNPVLGKSVVVYLRKPASPGAEVFAGSRDG